MKKYWTLFRIQLANNIAYRGHAFIWMLFDLLWIGVFPFIWFAIIESQGGELNGWSGSMIIMYYVLMAVLSNIVLMHPEASMADEIYAGEFSNHVVKPYSYLLYVFLHEATYKVVRFLLFLPFLIFLTVAALHFGGLTVSPLQLGYGALAAILAIPIFFLTAYIIGMTCFWLEDSYAARTIFWASSGLFGGQFAPFELMPKAFDTVAAMLPFKYALYFPLRVASQYMLPSQILRGFGIQMIWIVILAGAVFFIWKRGIKKYSAVGR